MANLSSIISINDRISYIVINRELIIYSLYLSTINKMCHNLSLIYDHLTSKDCLTYQCLLQKNTFIGT